MAINVIIRAIFQYEIQEKRTGVNEYGLFQNNSLPPGIQYNAYPYMIYHSQKIYYTHTHRRRLAL